MHGPGWGASKVLESSDSNRFAHRLFPSLRQIAVKRRPLLNSLQSGRKLAGRLYPLDRFGLGFVVLFRLIFLFWFTFAMRIVTRLKVPLGCLVLAVQVRSALKQCDDGAEFVLHNFGSTKHLASISPTST